MVAQSEGCQAQPMAAKRDCGGFEDAVGQGGSVRPVGSWCAAAMGNTFEFFLWKGAPALEDGDGCGAEEMESPSSVGSTSYGSGLDTLSPFSSPSSPAEEWDLFDSDTEERLSPRDSDASAAGDANAELDSGTSSGSSGSSSCSSSSSSSSSPAAPAPVRQPARPAPEARPRGGPSASPPAARDGTEARARAASRPAANTPEPKRRPACGPSPPPRSAKRARRTAAVQVHTEK